MHNLPGFDAYLFERAEEHMQKRIVDYDEEEEDVATEEEE